MSKFCFEIASMKDDPALKELLKANPMEGQIEVIFQAEPSYFNAVNVQGKECQIIIARQKKDNKIIGFGTRALRLAYLNGKVDKLGYLSNLRSRKEYRNGTLLARGYNYFKQLHNEDKKVRFYTTTIIEENAFAQKILTGKRSGLPAYHDWGLYYTFAVIPHKKKRLLHPNIKIEKGSKDRLGEIVSCMQRNGSKKQFYPYYTEEDFYNSNGFLQDFNIADFYVALRNNKVVGVIAKWDQSNFKQVIIGAYKGRIKILKPLVNSAAKIFGFPEIPLPNSQLQAFYVSHIAIDSNDSEIFRALLNHIYNEHVGSKYTYFLVGLHSRDPLSQTLKHYWHIKYKSRLFIVYWDEDSNFFKKLDDRIPYLEIGTL